MVLKALNSGLNVLLDGSLRDSFWYYTYITDLRLKYPQAKVAILYISCKIETALRRAENRGATGTRLVPREIIIESYNQIDRSIKILSPITSFVAQFNNEDSLYDDEDEVFEPKLLYATIHENDLNLDAELLDLPYNKWKQLFRKIWKLNDNTKQSKLYSTDNKQDNFIHMNNED